MPRQISLCLTMKKNTSTFLALLVGFIESKAQTNFSKVTTGPIVTTPGYFSSCPWGDYDNVGLIELFIGGGGGNRPTDTNNFLFHNEGNGIFTRVSSGSIVTDVSQSYGNSWGDYDNDGFLDLFVGNSYAHGDFSFLYHNNGNGTFTKITAGPIVENFGQCSGCAWGDFDKDGYLDLFVCNSGSPNFLYRNQGDRTFQQIITGDIVSTSGDSL